MTWIKFLKPFDEYKVDEQYELDDETAQKYVAADLCETVDNPTDLAISELKKELQDRDERLVKSITDAVKVDTNSPAIVVKDNEPHGLDDFCNLLATKQVDKLNKKYGNGQKVVQVGSDTAILPTPLAQEIYRSDPIDGNIAGGLRRVVMQSDTHKIPVLNQAGESAAAGKTVFAGGVLGGLRYGAGRCK